MGNDINGIAVAVQQFYEERKQDDLLPFCWRNQDCDSCLKAADFCSWCPFVCIRRLFLICISYDLYKYIHNYYLIYIYLFPKASLHS